MPKTTNWNEANTFSKLIEPYLSDLGYPPRRDKHHFFEQIRVKRRNNKSGPYDAAYHDAYGTILLVEAKREEIEIGKEEVTQAFDYALGGTFQPMPPPFVLVSNGNQHCWFRRCRTDKETYSYSPCEEVHWRKALEKRGAGELREELTIGELGKLLKQIRYEIFSDLARTYFPNGFSTSKSNLGRRRTAFERILNTRKCFVDTSLAGVKEETANRSILSSIALSQTLKVLFVKILTDLRAESFPLNLRGFIGEKSNTFPGILSAEPYDALPFSDACEEKLCSLLGPVGIAKAIVFEPKRGCPRIRWDSPEGRFIFYATSVV